MTTSNRINEFSRHPRKALFKLALPTITAMVVQTTYNMVDMVFVGRLGAAALAALTFSFPLYFILVSINIGMGVGLNSLISRQLGAGELGKAENSAMHGIAIALACALGLFFLFCWLSRPIFYLQGARSQVLELAVSYMQIIAAGSFFMLSSYAINSTFTAQGDTLTPMKVQISALLLNIILDPLFIFVLKKGVPGAAIATIISQGCGLLLFTWYLRKKSLLRLSLKRFSGQLTTVGEIFKVGIPASITMLLMAFYLMFLNRFMAHFGTEYVAAFGIVFRLESAVVMPLVAFAIALLTLTGIFHGAKQFPLLIKTFHFALKVTIIYALAIGILFFIFPTWFMSIFTNREDLLTIGATYMRIEVFSFPLMAIHITANRAMQGMGLGLPGITMNFVRIFVVAIPLAYVFVYLLHFSYLSVAVAMVCGGIAANLTALTWLRSIFAKLN